MGNRKKVRPWRMLVVVKLMRKRQKESLRPPLNLVVMPIYGGLVGCLSWNE